LLRFVIVAVLQLTLAPVQNIFECVTGGGFNGGLGAGQKEWTAT
jgi:hypothetical protein